MPCRGLRGLGDFLRRADEAPAPTKTKTNTKKFRRRRIRRGISKRYVRLRILAERVRSRDIISRVDLPSLSVGISASNYHPVGFRYRSTTPLEDHFESLMNLEVLDFEYWITELWQDFLIEPTPYVVASAITYLGFILLLVQYYTVMWQFFCFFVNFVPWDENVGFA